VGQPPVQPLPGAGLVCGGLALGIDAAQTYEQVKPVLSTFGNKRTHMGAIGMGLTAKLVHNQMLYSTLQVISESFAMGVKLAQETIHFIGRKGTVILVSGGPGATNLNQRLAGARQVAQDTTSAHQFGGVAADGTEQTVIPPGPGGTRHGHQYNVYKAAPVEAIAFFDRALALIPAGEATIDLRLRATIGQGKVGWSFTGSDRYIAHLESIIDEAGDRADPRDTAPAEVVLTRTADRDPAEACWALHRQGYRWIVAVSGSPSSQECIRLLNAGADYYIDAWLPAAELVARVKVVLRFSAWLAGSYDHTTLGHRPIPNAAGSRTHQ